ncbi:MAG: sigma-70 family RNA polymerase sigma factor [Chloroflexia bacterium]|nr:sigma-70 family RNA polymerase sigma factor [Chloroflexia bacterium]
MPESFVEFLSKIEHNDNQAILSLKKNIETIVFQSFSKIGLKLNGWQQTKGFFLYMTFFEQLFIEVKNVLLNNKFNDFRDYKDFILEKSLELSNPAFQNFINLIKCKNEQCWLIFDKILKKRIESWLVKKGVFNKDLIDTVYQDAQTLFVLKLKSGNLFFENSRALKSYLFKIINLKLYEQYRERKETEPADKLGLDEEYADHFETYLSAIERKEIEKHLLLRKLNFKEKTILVEFFFYEKRMKDIAKKLNISEVNCRLIKHRALARLEGKAKMMGYP